MADRPFPGEEPGAGFRQLARALREMYVSLTQEGFTTGEALQVIGTILSAYVGGQPK